MRYFSVLAVSGEVSTSLLSWLALYEGFCGFFPLPYNPRVLKMGLKPKGVVVLKAPHL